MTTLNMDEKTKRRDKLSIIADILEIAREGALKTQIMYKANLSFNQLKDYLNFLKNFDLLVEFTDDGKDVYSATEKGVHFIQRYYELTDLVKQKDARSDGIKLPPRHLLN